jgi:nucleoside-diphosphate-sugar epimerase
VTCLVRPGRNVANLSRMPGVKVIEVTSFQQHDLAAALAGVSADVVFNLASYGVQQKDRDPERLIDGNIRLLVNLLEATCRCKAQRFIHAGSCSEYSLPIPEGSLIDETHPIRPTSLYGAAKAACGIVGNALAFNLGIPFVTLRLFGVFGTHEGPQRLIPYVIDRLRNSRPVDLTPGEQIRDFLFEDDVAEAFIQAGNAVGLKPYETYNVCSSRPIQIRAVGEAVAASLKKPTHLLRWGERPYRPDEPMWLVGNNRRFVEATSWHPTISLEDGIGRMISGIQKSIAKQEMPYGV